MKRYLPDMKKHAALCEANFVRLKRLMGESPHNIQASCIDQHNNRVDISAEVIETFKYTQTIKLTKRLHDVPAPMDQVELIVRLYEDARMAEVVTWHQGKQLAGIYRYPNEQMYQIDEKEQANHYLAQWLSHILMHGISTQPWVPSQ